MQQPQPQTATVPSVPPTVVGPKTPPIDPSNITPEQIILAISRDPKMFSQLCTEFRTDKDPVYRERLRHTATALMKNKKISWNDETGLIGLTRAVTVRKAVAAA